MVSPTLLLVPCFLFGVLAIDADVKIVNERQIQPQWHQPSSYRRAPGGRGAHKPVCESAFGTFVAVLLIAAFLSYASSKQVSPPGNLNSFKPEMHLNRNSSMSTMTSTEFRRKFFVKHISKKKKTSGTSSVGLLLLLLVCIMAVLGIAAMVYIAWQRKQIKEAEKENKNEKKTKDKKNKTRGPGRRRLSHRETHGRRSLRKTISRRSRSHVERSVGDMSGIISRRSASRSSHSRRSNRSQRAELSDISRPEHSISISRDRSSMISRVHSSKRRSR